MLCQQIPSVIQVIHQIGMFYHWYMFDLIPIAKVVCMPWR